MLSENLEQSLHRAMKCAADRGAELVTLEHLLFALVEDCLLYTSPSPRD